MLIKTYSGEDVKFDKASLDSFNHGELPRIEYIHATENYYFCPYKGCINKYKNHRPRLFMHIRKTHDPSFPRLHGSGGLKFEFFTTQTGKKILFDEESCDIIDKDDSITVKKPSKKTFSSGKEPNSFTNNETCGTPSRLLPIAHCPYEGCVCLYTARTRLYLHIRKKHDPDFPSLAGKNPKWKFTTQSGQEIYFDADSRDMVGELETIIVVK
ncbi:hypothetical protein BJV82DRAFT_22244 [Fennellomyces sp. T-0311]|nr:hypothetical protein BJV82DRAFT_22244 [Fennellomyces sp. T-0311]